MWLFQLQTVFVLLVLLHAGFSWKIFSRGRGLGGNLGAPKDDDQPGRRLNPAVKTEWFAQKLDHFQPIDTRTWQQRYYVNDEFYNTTAGGPVFLMIGGEGEATIKWMTKGAWIGYAQKFGALCFQLEHRYYGKSHPTKDLSTKNLQYLTSQQALADLAFFITAMNRQHNLPADVKWIAFGGSYPGSLAAWLRSKSGNLVHGAMSASGPLLAEVDFLDYYRVVDEALAAHSPECVTAVKQGTSQVDILLRHMVGQRNINEKFQLCDPIEKSIDNPKDISNFFEALASNFAGVTQYNKDNREGSNVTLDTLCGIMTDQELGPPVARLARVNALLLAVSQQSCLDYRYDKMLAQLRNTSWAAEAAEGGRQWTYQTCTEFGFFQSSSYKPQVFGDRFPADFFVQQCVDVFGPRFNASFLEQAVERTNVLYGGLDTDVTNVVFVHGSVDPWHALGITKTVNQNAPAIYIQGTAHCANMYPEREDDLPGLKAARVQIANLIDSWIRL